MTVDCGDIIACIRSRVDQSPTAAALQWTYQPTQQPERTVTKSWSYASLWTVAAHAALILIKCCASLHTHVRVGLMIEEGPALPLLELAVLIAGFAVVPLDPGEPQPRLLSLLEDAALTALVLKEKTTQIADLCAQISVVLLDPADLLTSGQEELPTYEGFYEAPQVSHIFFTSGSTGRPKGCICSRANLLAYCQAKQYTHEVTPESVVFVASAHTFDPSLGDFFSTWLAGGCVALAPRSAVTTALGVCLATACATHLMTTPALFGATMEGAQAQVPTLRSLSLGGEPTPRRIVDAWSGSMRLLNTYGVTECTVYQTAGVLTPGSSPRLLGDAFNGTSLHLAAGTGNDPTDCVSNVDEQGELWISGSQVGLGYLRRPDLTAERFFDSWAALGPVFRTGDIAVKRAKGWELVGRRDGMVKIRGRRVELGEIEESLLSASDLLAAAAVTLVDRRIVAWCVPRSRDLGTRETRTGGLLRTLLRLLCVERLPMHMVPSTFALTDVLPTTATGKVSRRELVARALPVEEESVATQLQGRGQHLIAEVWSAVLGTPVNGSSNFGELGGDSLAALRVCKLLAAKVAPSTGEFGEFLPEPLLPQALMKRQQFSDFARHLSETVGGEFVDSGETEISREISVALVGCETNDLSSLLYQAAYEGADFLVRYLIGRVSVGGDHHAPRVGRSPLHAACATGHLDVVQTLLNAAASATERDSRGVQPIHLAAQGTSLPMVVELVKARAKVQALDKDKLTPLHHAARVGAPVRIFKELCNLIESPQKLRHAKQVSLPTSIDHRDKWGRTPLHWAVVNGHRNAVVWLLQAGSNRSIQDVGSETPVQIAERRAQCRAQDRPDGLGASVFGDIAVLLGGSAATAKEPT